MIYRLPGRFRFAFTPLHRLRPLPLRCGSVDGGHDEDVGLHRAGESSSDGTVAPGDPRIPGRGRRSRSPARRSGEAEPPSYGRPVVGRKRTTSRGGGRPQILVADL